MQAGIFGGQCFVLQLQLTIFFSLRLCTFSFSSNADEEMLFNVFSSLPRSEFSRPACALTAQFVGFGFKGVALLACGGQFGF